MLWIIFHSTSAVKADLKTRMLEVLMFIFIHYSIYIMYTYVVAM